MDRITPRTELKIIPDGWLPPGAAIAWIACGSAESSWDKAFYEGADRWPDMAPWDTSTEIRWLLNGRTPEDGVIPEVAWKVSERVQRSLGYGDDTAIWKILDESEKDARAPDVRRFLADLITELERDEAVSDALWHAADELRLAIALGRIPAFGRRSADSDDLLEPIHFVAQARERIPPEVCSAPVTIAPVGILPFVKGDAVFGGWQSLWHDILIPSADLLPAFPAPADGAPSVRYTPPTQTAANAAAAMQTRNKGGRPPTHDWDPFNAELVRRLALDGGEVSRTDFKREMKDWASENMDPMPEQRTIERQVDKLTGTTTFAAN